MTVAVKMICSERDARRQEVDVEATLRGPGATPIDVEIEDISVSGFRMLTSAELQNGDLITIGLAGLGMQPAMVVRRVPGRYGCQFINAVSQEYVDQLQFGSRNTVTPFVPATVLPTNADMQTSGVEKSDFSRTGQRLDGQRTTSTPGRMPYRQRSLLWALKAAWRVRDAVRGKPEGWS